MKNNRMEPFPHSGIVLVDKPKDWTSHDVVNFIRGRFNVKKVGHCGTLDPAATGLLVIVLGHATKMSQQLSGSDKTYEATILFGKETDSQDMDGQVVSEKDCSFLTEEMIRAEFAKFAGEMEQIPPMVSAQKIDGKRLYELARAGKEVEREAKKITIHSMDVRKIYLPYTDFVLKCSKGTYVRTICYDIGKALGCGAVLFNLRRTVSGEFNVANAVGVETMRSWSQEDLFRAIVEF